MMATDEAIDLRADIIDVRDMIARFEYLEGQNLSRGEEEWDERKALRAVLDELEGQGGDEQWRGAWYPITLIADSYLEDYARETADDLYGAEMRAAHWPFSYIDWEAATDAFRMDYTSIEIDGLTYWYR